MFGNQGNGSPTQGQQQGTFQEVRYGKDGSLNIAVKHTMIGQSAAGKDYANFTLTPETAIALASELGKFANQNLSTVLTFFPETRHSAKLNKSFTASNLVVRPYVPKEHGNTHLKNYAPVDPVQRAQQVASSMGATGSGSGNQGQGSWGR